MLLTGGIRLSVPSHDAQAIRTVLITLHQEDRYRLILCDS
jgi:hypothetical protein